MKNWTNISRRANGSKETDSSNLSNIPKRAKCPNCANIPNRANGPKEEILIQNDPLVCLREIIYAISHQFSASTAQVGYQITLVSGGQSWISADFTLFTLNSVKTFRGPMVSTGRTISMNKYMPLLQKSPKAISFNCVLRRMGGSRARKMIFLLAF